MRKTPDIWGDCHRVTDGWVAQSLYQQFGFVAARNTDRAMERPSVAEVPPKSEDEQMRAFAELAKLTQELKMEPRNMDVIVVSASAD